MREPAMLKTNTTT